MSERHPDAGTMSMAMAQPIQGQKLFGRLEPLSIAMLLCVGCVCFIILAHLAVILWLSVIEGSPGAAVHSYSWKNYLEVLTDGRTVDVLINTFGFSVVSLVVALLFGLPAAWLVERTDLRGKTLLYTLMTIGMLIPGFAAAMGWLFLMHPRIGLLNVWGKQLFGLDNSPFDIASVVGMGWVQGLNLAPLAFIMTAAVFRAMDPALEEAAQTSRANWLRTMWRVTLPLAWPGIMAASIYIFTIGFAAFDVPAIIGWSNRVFTFSTFLYLLISPQDVLPRYGVAAALSTIVMALAAAFLPDAFGLCAFHGLVRPLCVTAVGFSFHRGVQHRHPHGDDADHHTRDQPRLFLGSSSIQGTRQGVFRFRRIPAPCRTQHDLWSWRTFVDAIRATTGSPDLRNDLAFTAGLHNFAHQLRNSHDQ